MWAINFRTVLMTMHSKGTTYQEWKETTSQVAAWWFFHNTNDNGMQKASLETPRLQPQSHAVNNDWLVFHELFTNKRVPLSIGLSMSSSQRVTRLWLCHWIKTGFLKWLSILSLPFKHTEWCNIWLLTHKECYDLVDEQCSHPYFVIGPQQHFSFREVLFFIMHVLPGWISCIL